MKMMKDYHNLFLKCFVLLLGNICEKFRNSSLNDSSTNSYMVLKIFDKDLVAILKCKFTLKLNKAAYVGISILDFSKV